MLSWLMVTRWVIFTRWVTVPLGLIIPNGTMIHDARWVVMVLGILGEGGGVGRRQRASGYDGITNNFLFFQIIQ